FTVDSNSRVFLTDSPCPPSGVGIVDVTQGHFTLSAGPIRTLSIGPEDLPLFGRTVRTPVCRASIGADGATFSTTYEQVGQVGRTTTTVTSGTVQVTDVTTGAVTVLTAGQQMTVTAEVPAIVASVLPSSRSVQVGHPATVFATMLNAGTIPTTVCQPSLVTNVPATLDYQTTDPATNQVIGTRDTPISIPGHGSQSFVVVLTPTAPIPSIGLQLTFACGGTVAPTIAGVSTLLLSASPVGTPVPDIVALAASATPGTVRVSGLAGAGVFAVATVNLGAAETITASADTNGVALPVTISICQTDSTTSACLAPPASTVTTPVKEGATPTFGIFVTGN